MAGFWTPTRDAELRLMWAQTPRPTLRAMAEAFGLNHAGRPLVTPEYISTRGGELGLPPLKGGERIPRGLRQKPPPPPPRVEMTPCPYIDPRASLDPVTRKVPCCGVMVDRRRRRDGSKPSQYCAEHAPRVTPIAAGMSIGAGSRAGSRMLNAGAKFGGVLG